MLVECPADEQAPQAAATADRSANATERMVMALERRELEEERQAPEPGVVWRLEHFQNDAYLLSNMGRTNADDVKVELGDTCSVRASPRAPLSPQAARSSS